MLSVENCSTPTSSCGSGCTTGSASSTGPVFICSSAGASGFRFCSDSGYLLRTPTSASNPWLIHPLLFGLNPHS